MNEDEAAQAIDRIVDGAGTKAYRARKLFELGCDRSDVTELLDMSYSQAHSIWKKEGYGRDTGVQGGGREDDQQRSTASEDHQDEERHTHGRALRLSPTQVRFITQDGHVVIRVDKEGGPVCRHCDRRLTFSLRYLGFIHTDSTTDPTDMEDRYD